MSDWQAIEDRIVERVAAILTKVPITKRLLSTRDAAEYLGCDETTLRNLHAAGEIPAVRNTSRVQYDIQDLDALIARNKR